LVFNIQLFNAANESLAVLSGWKPVCCGAESIDFAECLVFRKLMALK